MTTLYGIPNCDTVKKARAWLAEHCVEHTFHDFKKQGVPEAALRRWLEVLGHETVINRKGSTWRGLDERSKAQVVDNTSAHALAIGNASLIKRPVVEWDHPENGLITVGFDTQHWVGMLPSIHTNLPHIGGANTNALNTDGNTA